MDDSVEFFKMYKKSLMALFVSLGYQIKEGGFQLSMVEFFEELWVCGCVVTRRSRLNGIDFPLCSACLEQTKKEKLKCVVVDACPLECARRIRTWDTCWSV